MNEQLASFLDKKRTEQEEAKLTERNDLLIRLGLTTVTREYAPDSITTMYDANVARYNKMDTDGSRRRFYRETATPIEISDEEYNELLLALGKDAKAPQASKVETSAETPQKINPTAPRHFTIMGGSTSRSKAAIFFRVLAFLEWALGIILFFVSLSQRYEYSSYLEPALSFSSFSSLILFGAMGAAMFFMAEICQNIQNISDRLASMAVRADN